ncbi:unnamed protein product [Linum trigynum]|uniref:Pectinesterase inhibitor domain-containing protein n=1 Tax=Linum trigynum TaxID=586398 RepID=A0AAV2FPL1_9ROSI
MDPKSPIFLLVSITLLSSLLHHTKSTAAARNDAAPPTTVASTSSSQHKQEEASQVVIDPALRGVCSVTDNPSKCVELIAPYVIGATDPVSILNMEIAALYKMVEDSKSTATRVARSPSTPPSVVKVLDECMAYYDSATDDLAKALFACSVKDTQTVNRRMASAVTSFQKCDAAFEGKQGAAANKLEGEAATMHEMDEVMVQMVGFAMQISQKLVSKATAADNTKIVN